MEITDYTADWRKSDVGLLMPSSLVCPLIGRRVKRVYNYCRLAAPGYLADPGKRGAATTVQCLCVMLVAGDN